MKPNRMTETPDAPWQSLYNLAGAAALILLLYSLATLFIMALTGGQPATVEEVFSMLREDRLMGLLRLDALTVFVMPLYYLLFLGLFIALRRARLADALLATVLAFAGLTLFLATPSVFSYLFLSDQYAAAATADQQARLLAAGEAILASDMWHGTGALVGGMLLQSGALLISVVMLRGTAFGKATAYLGILTHGLDLVHLLVGLVAPEAGNLLMYAAGPLYLLWFPLVARGFFRLGRESVEARTQPVQSIAVGD